jgi:hypothetical protein
MLKILNDCIHELVKKATTDDGPLRVETCWSTEKVTQHFNLTADLLSVTLSTQLRLYRIIIHSHIYEHVHTRK